MPRAPTMEVGQFYPTHDGDVKVIYYHGCDEVVVEFIESGYQRIAKAADIRNKEVKDPYRPSIHGIGFIGVGEYRATIKGKKTKAYNIWASIFQRCYCPIRHETHAYNKDCTVVEEWFNFQNFAEWFYKNYKEGFDLDKDLKVWGNTEYGPNTCAFVDPKINRGSAKNKHLKTKSFIKGNDYTSQESQMNTILGDANVPV